MFELTEILSSWWGALVVLGLILLNSIALAGYWGRYQVDRRFAKLIDQQESEKNIREQKNQGNPIPKAFEIHFFEDWSNRIYFMLTMGCALLLISLPLFPIDNRTRFLLWMALSVSTMFGVYRLYLAWYGRDRRLRTGEHSGSSRTEYEESLDRLSETDEPSRLLETETWLDMLWRRYSTPVQNRVPISLIAFIIIGHQELDREQGRLAADRVTVIVGEAISKTLRDDDLVCQVESDRYFAALIDCPRSNLLSIGDRLTKNLNRQILDRASKIYQKKLALLYITLDISDMFEPVPGGDPEREKQDFWKMLKENARRMGDLA
ncbi:MAG: hypothetical protein JXA25_07850 [Anaerolineales bacterium]|nr:hypothetical protein [Anaerolineales bacterium]